MIIVHSLLQPPTVSEVFDSLSQNQILWMVNMVRSLYFTFHCNHQWFQCSITTLSVLKIVITILQAHQELSRSYKEICAPVIERCHFLFHELRPACGDEVHSLTRSRLLQSNTRWNCVVSSLIEQIKRSKKGTSHIYWLSYYYVGMLYWPYSILHQRINIKLINFSM